MVPASVLIGGGLWLACAVTLMLARAGVAAAPVALAIDGTIATLDLLVLGAVTLVALRAHTASAEEVRRVVVFSAGFLLFMGVSSVYNVAEVFAPGDWVSNYRWSPTILLMEVLRFPGLILLWYAVLAARIPHLREAVRALYHRLLLRPGLLGAVAAVPAGALAWLIGRSPERAVGAVIADPLAQALFAAVGILLLLIAARERILMRLDTWILPESADQRQALADAAGALARASRITTVGETVTRTVRRGCGSPATLLVADDAETRADGFSAPQARCAPLGRQTAIVHLLETVGGPVRVEPDRRPSVFPLLPPDEAAWVTETGADVIVPAPGPGTDVLGVLVVGRRLDGRRVRSLDLPFLETLGAAAGLALARLQLLDAPGAGSGEAPAAEECPVCRSVTAVGELPACACGPAPVATEVPKLLAGKFRLTRRLGAGGMGVVYLARDLRLERNVAIKILTESSAVRLVGLKPEAWAMATVTHPGVAQIHGVETWRGRPFLIVEFLPGGTLEDRLRDGPIAPAEAVSVVATLADALAALHAKGFLHGDIKPSNIGFTAEGAPKLLDFGLAHAVDDAAMVGGTLPYLSPEVLAGRGAEEADDVWSLSVVLYEMVSGRHPFAGGTLEAVRSRIRRQRIATGGPAATAPPASAAAVAAFAASILTAPGAGGRGPRPSSPRRWPQSPGTRSRNFFKLFSPCLFGSLLPYVIGVYWEYKNALLPESGRDLSSDGATCGRRSVIDTVCTRISRPVQVGNTRRDNLTDDSRNSLISGARGERARRGAQRPAAHLTHRPRTEPRTRFPALARAALGCVLALAALATPALAQALPPSAMWSWCRYPAPPPR